MENPLLLGFERTRVLMERASRAAVEGYPPYNIEDLGEDRIRITLAVAGFASADLSVSTGDNQLAITGRRESETGAERDFIHRGIAARNFSRVFVLADGMEVVSATLEDGLLHIEAERPPANSKTRQIPIRTTG
jgi:HSP20 family molecular chaperone IbpA